MAMRSKLIGAVLLVALLVALLVPLSHVLSSGQKQAQDAEHMVEPMLAMMAQRPQVMANAAVDALLELEDAWEIEDGREECWETPLVVAMRNGDSELGYDAPSNTFYCTLGMDGGDDWPEIALFAQGAEGTENLRVAWIDDYAYDYRSDAIRDGYRYELLAYTDTQYAYFGVVFTGLPIVTLHVDGDVQALGDEYVPGRISISSAEHEPVHSGMWVHLRGGGFRKPIEKKSYRVELHGMSDKGRDEKQERSVLGMPADTDWLLLGNAQDPTAVRNHMAWDLWNRWNEGDNSVPMLMQSQMVEVFVQNEYVGLYQIMQRSKEEEELARIGGNVQTDSVVRIVSGANTSEKPLWDLLTDVNYVLEYRYDPQDNAQRALERVADYVALSRWKNGNLEDEAFAEMVSKRIDVKNLMNYYAFFHGVSLRDHVFNNIYLYTLMRENGPVYLHALWDMDTAFMPPENETGDWQGLDMNMTLTTRMMNLNLLNCREVFWSIWNEKRQSVFSDDALSELIRGTQDRINASGAYLRESERWYGEAIELNMEDLLYYQMHNVSRAESTMMEMWPVQ